MHTQGLVEGVRYQFFVTAENGVSSVASTTPAPILVFSEFTVDNSTFIVVVALTLGIGLTAIIVFVIFVELLL